MRVRPLLLSLVVTLLGGVLAAMPVEARAAAPTARISFGFPAGQQLGIEAGDLTKSVTARVSDCAQGCALVRVTFGRREQVTDVLAENPGQAGPVTLTAKERYEVAGITCCRTYAVDVVTGDPPDTLRVAEVALDAGYLTETALAYSAAWTHGFRSDATETLARTSTRSGDVARWVVPGSPAGATTKVGVVTARGPGMGVLRVLVDGVVRATVDLASTTPRPRVVPVWVDATVGAQVRLVNASAPTSTRRTVVVDGVVTTRHAPPGTAFSTQAPGDVPTPGGFVLPLQPAPGQLPRGYDSFQPTAVTITAETPGCPTGCRLEDDAGTVIASWTTPTGSTSRHVVPAVLPAVGGRYFVSGDGFFSDSAPWSATLRTDDATDAAAGPPIDYAGPWSVDANSTVLGGTIHRTSTPGAAATFRPQTRTFHHPIGVVAARGPRNGVLAVYVEGVLAQTVDLRADRWSPRQVVAGVLVPARGRVTVVNATPAGRTGADVHVDGFVVLVAEEE